MSAEEPVNYTNLFLAPVPKSVRNDDLFQIFKASGATSASVMMDVNSGRSKGFAFIAFENSEDGEKALRQLSGTTCTAPTGEVFTLNLSVSSHKKHQSVIESNVVYFRNLPLNAPIDDIRTRLEKYGKISNLTQKPDSNQKFLLATVEFEELAGAKAAVSEGHGKVLFPEHSTFPVMCKYADNYATKQARRQRRQQSNEAAEKDSFSSGGHSSGFSSGNEWGGSGHSSGHNSGFNQPQQAAMMQGNPLSQSPMAPAAAGMGYPAQQQQVAGYAHPQQQMFYQDQAGSPNNFAQQQQYQQYQQQAAYQQPQQQYQQAQQYLNQQQQYQQPQQYHQQPAQQQQYQQQQYQQQPQAAYQQPQMQGYAQPQQQQFAGQYQQQPQQQPQQVQQIQVQQPQQSQGVTTTVINAEPVAQQQRPLGGGPMDADDGGSHSFSTGKLSRGDDDSHSISSSDSGKYRRNPYSNTGPVTIQVDDRRGSRTSSAGGDSHQ